MDFMYTYCEGETLHLTQLAGSTQEIARSPTSAKLDFYWRFDITGESSVLPLLGLLPSYKSSSHWLWYIVDRVREWGLSVDLCVIALILATTNRIVVSRPSCGIRLFIMGVVKEVIQSSSPAIAG